MSQPTAVHPSIVSVFVHKKSEPLYSSQSLLEPNSSGSEIKKWKCFYGLNHLVLISTGCNCFVDVYLSWTGKLKWSGSRQNESDGGRHSGTQRKRQQRHQRNVREQGHPPLEVCQLARGGGMAGLLSRYQPVGPSVSGSRGTRWEGEGREEGCREGRGPHLVEARFGSVVEHTRSNTSQGKPEWRFRKSCTDSSVLDSYPHDVHTNEHTGAPHVTIQTLF